MTSMATRKRGLSGGSSSQDNDPKRASNQSISSQFASASRGGLNRNDRARPWNVAAPDLPLPAAPESSVPASESTLNERLVTLERNVEPLFQAVRGALPSSLVTSTAQLPQAWPQPLPLSLPPLPSPANATRKSSKPAALVKYFFKKHDFEENTWVCLCKSTLCR